MMHTVWNRRRERAEQAGGSSRMITRRVFAGAAAGLLACSSVRAQSFPTKPIHLVVPYAAGTSTDLTARQISPKLASVLHGTVVVDNRGGAGGVVGAEAVARAAPDGYTLLIAGSQTNAINASLYAKLPYDPVKDFTPIARVAAPPMVLVVPPSLGVHSVAELVALAKSKPGKLNYASSGIGTSAHLCGSWLGKEAGIDLVHVPYNSAAQAFSDLMNGEVSLMFYPYLPLASLIQAKKLEVLATTGADRPPYLPDAPTMREAGYKDFVITPWFAVYGPAHLPAPVVDKLSDAILTTLKEQDIVQRLLATGNDPFPGGPEELARFTVSEVERYRGVVAASGAKVE
jgi:tripartite-type tricarboxylate transporter receptor subunit TctC